VSGPLQHRTRVIAGAALIALICWRLLPGTELDKAAFSLAARSFANPPFFISGFGSHETPWNLRTFSSASRSDSREAPLIVSLGDDPAGVFQSSPPSPVDLAVILNNFQRLGAKKAATAAVLAWDEPDPIGLAALDLAIGRFESLVMVAPLSRGVVPEQMPAAFRRTSVPVSAVLGDASLLPVVNRIPLNGVILGGKNTSAGFQLLDSEPLTAKAPLLARWEDRIVFAFPLVVMLQRLALPVDQLEIHPGGFLKFGKKGPIIPIDLYGRLDAPIKNQRPYAIVSAEELIDGNDSLFPKHAPDPAILRDDRSGTEPATRDFSVRLPSLIAAIASDAGLARARDYPRPRAIWEFVLLGTLCALIWCVTGLAAYPRRIVFALLAGAIISLQLAFIGIAEIWLPGLAALAALAGACAISYWPAAKPQDQVSTRESIVEIPAAVETEPELIQEIPAPAAVEKPPRRPRKTPVRKEKPAAPPEPQTPKPAAKKNTARKTPAKKAAPRRKKTENPPPPDSAE
jgi:hypothetical protein